LSREGFSSGIKILEEIVVVIPVDILFTCDYIASKVGGNEFSILTKIESRKDNEVTLSKAFYIPKQKVSSASIDYISDSNAEGYEVVIHRHPDGMENFSATDRDYINQNFRLSLLYTHARGFVNGVFNMKAGDRYLIPLRVRPMIKRDNANIDLRHICQGSLTARTWIRGSEWKEEEYDFATGKMKEVVASSPTSASRTEEEPIKGYFGGEKASTVAIGYRAPASGKFDSAASTDVEPGKKTESEKLFEALSGSGSENCETVLDSINEELQDIKQQIKEERAMKTAEDLYREEEERFSTL